MNGCGNKEAPICEQEIVFIYRELYYESYNNSGYFIDNTGDKYSFDLSDKEFEYELDEELYEYLVANKENLLCEPYLSQQELIEWYGYLCEIDSDAEIEQGLYSLSGGGDVFLGIRLNRENETEIILLESTGCWGKINTDINAKKLAEVFKKKEYQY